MPDGAVIVNKLVPTRALKPGKIGLIGEVV